MKQMKSTMPRTAMMTAFILIACLLTAFGGGPVKPLTSNDRATLLLPTTTPIPKNPVTESAQRDDLSTDRTQAGPGSPASSDPQSASEVRRDNTMIVGQGLPKGEGLKPTPELSGAEAEKLVPSPDQEPLLPLLGDPPKTTDLDPTAALVAAPGWNTVMSEGFEGAFPSGAWSAYDGDGSTNGEYFWDDTSYRSYSGSWSGWAARGGVNGVDPASYYYPDNARSWMVYGPFDLSDSSDAELLFYYWNQSEVNYDWFGWYASTNGTDFYGSSVSGDSLGWSSVNFDLTAVPSLGNVTGDSSVWIAFIFTSDVSNVDDGPFVDNVVLQKYISSSQPNLTAYTPSGWDYPIVPSTSTGTHSVSTLSSEQNTYIDWAITNSGPTTSTTFVSCLYFDNSQLQCWDTNGIAQNAYAYVEDWLLNLSPTAGSHILKIVTDVNNNVVESNEGDNTWQMSFTWTSSCPASSYSPQNITSLALDGPSPLSNDALPLPHNIMQRRASETASLADDPRSNLPGRYNTSVFMTGKVAVGIILPESTGNGENWTTAEQNCVVQKIQKGLDWWKTRGGSTANLSFVYDTHLGIPTAYEPIDQDTSNQGLWIQQVMTNMGYTDSDYWEQVYSYVNHLRDQNNADWAYVFIVADSSNDADGTFPDGYFGYAYLGGPFVIMTYDNDGWGIDDMNWVATHETGHIFMAADQYYQEGYGGCQSTTERYGYLGVANSNCEYNNPNSVPSIMRSNEDTLENSARGQIGWQDSNGNGVFDPIDTSPGFNLPQQSPDPTTQTVLSYTGYVYDTPWPHASCGSSDQCAYEDITLQKITSAQYRVDGGSWLNVSPMDGALDSDFEDITFTTSSLSNGLHTIEVKASNSKGRSSTWVDQVTVNASYQLTVSKAGAGSGTVTSSPAGINCGSDCLENYASTTSVTLSAVAATGSSFAGWSGACSGTGTCSVSMTAARSVTATFTLNNYALNVSKSGTGSGTVTSNPAGISCGSDCSESFAYNTMVTLTASATSPSTFAGWSGGGCSGTGTCTITMSSAQSVTATFNAPGNQTLTVTKTGSGIVTSSPAGINCGSDCSESFAYNTVVTLSASVIPPSTFGGWSGGGCSGTGTCIVTMSTAKSVTATFNAPGYQTLTVIKSGTGSGTVSSSPAGIDCGADCLESYSYNTTIMLTATPATGSSFTGWSGGGCSGRSTCTVNLTSATAITANFIVISIPDGGPDTTGVFRPSNGLLYLKNKNDTGFADAALNYGLPGDYPVVGDWDGNGTVTIGIYRGKTFYLRNENTNGFATIVFDFGQAGDQPIAGDWNGDGIDTIGIFRPSTAQFLLRNSNDAGPAEATFYLGNPGDVGIAGDWNGDGKDTTGVFRPSNGVIFLKDTNDSGFADYALNYGLPGDRPVMGDWDNDGLDTIGIYRNGTFYLRNENTNGFASIVFGLGNPGDMPIAGNWDGIP